MNTVEDQREWRELNNAFHFRQYEASGWPKLCSILANLRDESNGYMSMVILEARKSGHSALEHKQILGASKAVECKGCAEGDCRSPSPDGEIGSRVSRSRRDQRISGDRSVSSATRYRRG